MINRRNFTRGLIAFLLLGTIALNCAFNGSCGKPAPGSPPPDPAAEKAKAIAFARDVARAFRIVTPLITANKPELAAKLQHITASADKLITAVEASNNTDAVKLLADILPTFEEISAEFTTNPTVAIALAVANAALSFFADHFRAAVAGGASMAVASKDSKKILQFRDGYHLRARSAVTGQFITVEYAQAHPSETVIERVKN